MQIDLNDRWRIVESDDKPPCRQWLLQSFSAGKWKSRSFCQTRQGLLTAIHEKVVKGGSAKYVAPSVLDRVVNLPERIAQRVSP